MFRRFSMAAVLLSVAGLIADDGAPEKLDNDDPLYNALRKLRRDVEKLRGEIRGAQSKPRGMRPFNGEPKAASRRKETDAFGPTLDESVSQPSAISIEPATSDHWSFQLVQRPAPPPISDEDWIRDDLDRFILAKLEQAELNPNPDADRYTLVRRLAFDLTGLPPTETEIRGFVNDPAPIDKALARVVDQYLASDRFGERWGRHWLDVVRYADSVGRNWNAPFTYAWRYRDYVIDSLNEDKPYDRFIIEQLAGDLLPADDLQARREQIIATGFLALGPMDIIVPEGEKLMMDRVDEQIDVTTRAMLGLTVSCARCHDHKYEPITMRDYYALAGVFYSTNTLSGQRRGNYVTDDDLHLLPSTSGRKSPVPGVHSMADMTREHRTGGWREVLWTTDPNLAMGAAEGRVEDCPIRTDGDFYKRGETPPRGDFHIAGMSGLDGIAADWSGRLQLARWIASPDNPLTSRVMVNRVWQHLFGRGLVPSVDDFGSTGQRPTHPDLLDHLAHRLMHGSFNGKPKAPASETPNSRLRLAVKPKRWSIKSLIRSIVLSRTYRLSSRGQDVGKKVDPANNLYWRMNAKRLEMEAVRDAMLAASGRLTFRRPRGIQVAGRGGKGRWGETRSLLSIHSPYRTVYLPVLRSLLPEMYRTFDFPNPAQVKGQREVTTVAPQSLFLMNSDFANQCARDASRRLCAEPGLSDPARVRLVYLRLVGRQPSGDEIESAIEFLDSLSPAAGARDAAPYRWSALVQALMISGEFRTLL